MYERGMEFEGHMTFNQDLDSLNVYDIKMSHLNSSQLDKWTSV